MVVFPSWLPFFLYDSSRKDKTQRTQSPQDAKNNAAQRQKNVKRSDKGRSAKRRTQRTPKARTYPKSCFYPANIPQMAPKLIARPLF